MVRMPPKVVIEKYLRPNGLPEDLIKEIRIESHQGPGERNPWYWQNDVERFVEARRPKSLDKKSYGEEEGFKVIAANVIVLGERIASALEQLAMLGPREAALPSPTVQMLTAAEAASQMRLHVQTVREWCREGKLGVMTGGRWLISPDEVKQYLRGQLLIKGKVAG